MANDVHYLRHSCRICIEVHCCFLSIASYIDFFPPLVIAVAAGMHATLYLLKKYVECDTNSFTSFVVCPACYSLYKFEDCICIYGTGQTIPKKCTRVLFPNHPQRNRRLPCGTPLMKKINMSGGKVKYVPRYTYAYQPVKKSLQ